MYQTIIVPIDLAQETKGRSILDLAVRLGGGDARIVLTNILEELPGYVAIELPAGLIEQSRRDAEDKLKAIAKDAGRRCRDRGAHRAIPATRSSSWAEEKKADLIIVASHRPGLQDYFIGSRRAGFVRHAKCSVFVTR
jgi:Universal stress protein UspA and related nucleotide-binding proteins